MNTSPKAQSSTPLNARVREYLTRLSRSYVVTPALRDEALALAEEVRTTNSAHGAARAAGHLGITVEEYQQRVADGQRRCAGCHAWHPVSEFGRDRSRQDGINRVCRVYARAYQRRRSQRGQESAA